MWFAVCVCLLGIHSEPSCWLALDTWNYGTISARLLDLVLLNRKSCSFSRNLSCLGHVQLPPQAKPERNQITGITPLQGTVCLHVLHLHFCGH